MEVPADDQQLTAFSYSGPAFFFLFFKFLFKTIEESRTCQYASQRDRHLKKDPTRIHARMIDTHRESPTFFPNPFFFFILEGFF